MIRSIVIEFAWYVCNYMLTATMLFSTALVVVPCCLVVGAVV